MCLQSPIQSRCLSPPSPACSVTHPILCSADCTHTHTFNTHSRASLRARARPLWVINRIHSRRSRNYATDRDAILYHVRKRNFADPPTAPPGREPDITAASCCACACG